MIDEIAWELVPPSMPDNLPLWVTPALDQADIVEERVRRAYGWAHRLLDQFSNGPGLITVITASVANSGLESVEDVSAGFIPFRKRKAERALGTREQYISAHPGVPIVEAAEVNYSFGIVIGVAAKNLDGGETNFIREPGAFVTLDGGFPVIVERREIDQQGPPSPSGSATSTCYATPRAGKKYYSGITWTDGIIVARHVLKGIGTTAGTSVPMSGGTSSTVVDIDGSTTIDAAILDAGPTGIPSTATDLHVSTVSPIGKDVTVRGQHSSFTAEILRVMDDPNYFGNMVAHRVFLDDFGSSGDSGGLTTLNSSSDAIGLYIGNTPSPKEGLVQSMKQVCEYFEVDLKD